MHRRRLLAAGAGLGALSIAGCADGDEPADGESGPDDDTGADDTGADRPTHARSGAGVPGRIDPLGHAVADASPFYTAAALGPDARWGLLGSFPTGTSAVASTLVDLETVAEPAIAHELEATVAGARTNAVTFDALRDGLYYRSQEGERHGIEVVDFGWAEGTPESPAVVASLETPNVGVHRLVAHPTDPVLYLVDTHPDSDAGVRVVDVSDPAAPEVVASAGASGGCHDVTYDPGREVLHAAYVVGPSEGYVVYDASEPTALRQVAHFEYDERPDYAALGEPGFQHCHQVDYDPERELVVVGDEIPTGIPGGKHVFDVGWDEGSLEEPVPIGFTHAPDARPMSGTEAYWWTSHFHDVVPKDGETLLVDGGYRQGAWVCNVTNPREPTPTERIATVADIDAVPPGDDNYLNLASPPFAWEATYDPDRDVVFASDSLTGAYTFEVSTAEARGDRGRGPDGHYDAAAVLEDDVETVANGKHGF